jgi:hypothetical protein
MGFFSTILQKLGLKKDESEAAAAAPAAATPAAAKPQAPATPAKPAVTAAAAKPEPAMSSKERDDIIKSSLPPRAMAEVDVVSKLEGLAKGKDLNWKVSIVDLLKLLDIDSSREARNELATELGCPADLMSDSAKMNVWLHKTVLKKISENGGNIPASLLD